jgi:ornithine cyclodeaminase/alanine dehydrogenase-like protein (mu-crystallin family)
LRFIDAAAVEAALSYPRLVDVLAEAFRTGAHAPPRHHHTLSHIGREDAIFLLMPAWEASAAGAETAGRYLGVKVINVIPDNPTRGRPAVSGIYPLFSADTGELLAVMDATKLTVWRTAAASALASRYLSRPDAANLCIVGAGHLAPYLVRAHASVRPIRKVSIWNRTPARAEAMAASLAATGLAVEVAVDLEAAVRAADIVSCATFSNDALVQGAWLRPGQHVDLVGAFKPTMRETDDEVIRRARVWVDTYEGAMSEAGDLLQPIAAGIFAEKDIQGDLAGLVRGTAPVRRGEDEITLFKSVGASIEDLAAAIAVYERPAG